MNVTEAGGKPPMPLLKTCGKCDYSEVTGVERCPRCQNPLFDEKYARTSALLPLLGGIAMLITGIGCVVSIKQWFATRTLFRADDAMYLKLSVAFFTSLGIFGVLMLGFAALQMKTGKLYRRTSRALFIVIPSVWFIVEIYLAFVALR